MIDAAITAAVVLTIGLMGAFMTLYTVYCFSIRKEQLHHLIFLFIGWWVFITALIYISRNTL